MFDKLGQMMGLLKNMPKLQAAMAEMQGKLGQIAAEGNAGAGFVVDTTTARFKGNRAQGNGGKGFHIAGSGNGLETNSATANGGLEFDIAAGNTDLSGNKANGSSFSFGPGAITRE